METVCIYYNGARASTVKLMREAAEETRDAIRKEELRRIADKLDTLPDGGSVCLALA
jgi:hypothetical protein